VYTNRENLQTKMTFNVIAIYKFYKYNAQFSSFNIFYVSAVKHHADQNRSTPDKPS